MKIGIGIVGIVKSDVVEKIEAVEVNERDHPIKDIVIEGIELVK